MEPAKHRILIVVFSVITIWAVVQANAAESEAGKINERRQVFLDGVLFTAGRQEAAMLKPPLAFNTKDVLAGIKDIDVVAEDLPPVLEQYGLSSQDIKTEVAKQLGRSRIEVIAEQPLESEPVESIEDVNESRKALALAADIESDEDFLEYVSEYLQRRQRVSQSAIFDITVTGVVDETAGFAAYSIHVQLLQEVMMLRDEPRRSLATTWQIGTVGYTSLDRLEAVIEQIRKIVDQFIVDYREANPDITALPRRYETRTPASGVVVGIIRSEDRSSAVVGIKVVREGDIIDGVTVVKIHSDKVEFEKDGQRWTQGINDPPGELWK